MAVSAKPQAQHPQIRKPRSDDRPLWEIVFGVYGCPAVMLAHKLGLFPLLHQKPRTLDEICSALGIAPRAAEAILAANTSLGFVRLNNGRFRLTPLSEDYLLPDSPTYFGSYFDIIIGNYAACSIEAFEKAARSGKPQVYGGEEVFQTHEAKADLARAFTRAMHSMSMAAALAWPERLDLSRHRVMLDVGGGSGAHAIAATRRWPKLQAIILDLAPVCEVAREIVARQGPPGRIRTHTADMWKDPFPQADLHFYSCIFHDWPYDQCCFLARKSFESLPSGGRIILHEVLYNDRKTGPFAAAAYSMIMLAWATGRQYSGKELKKILTDAGFVGIEIKPTFGYMSIVTGRKP